MDIYLTDEEKGQIDRELYLISRDNDIFRDINTLNSLFLEFKDILEMQGEKISLLEVNLDEVEDKTTGSEKHLSQTNDYISSWRKINITIASTIGIILSYIGLKS